MNSRTAILFAICFLACAIGSENPTCANHPILLKATDFLTRSTNGNERAAKLLTKFVEKFKVQNPSTLSAEQLGVCSQYANQSTCCTEKLVGFLDKAAALSASKILKSENSVHKLARLIYKVLKRNDCTSSIAQKIIENAQLIKLQAYRTSVQTCKKQFVKAVASLNRGAMCAICAGVDKVNDYFVDGVLGVSVASAQGFEDEVTSAFACLKSALYDGDTLNEVISEAIAFYSLTTNACTSSLFTAEKAAIKRIFGTLSGSSTDSGSNKKCNAKVLFNERTVCDAAQNGEATIDTDGDSYGQTRFLGADNFFRALSETEDTKTVSTGGISVYVTSNTDNNISSDGDVSVSFTDDEDSALARLQYFALFALLLFITL